MSEAAERETCLSWTPIPAQFSGNWQVDVVHLAEDYSAIMRPGDNLVIVVAAFSDPTATTARENAAWRINFTGCRAYRKRTIGYSGASPLTRPDQAAAFWEVAHSRYLTESGVRTAFPKAQLHHYVILAELHTAYEILALGWHCTPLPSEWARPFTGGQFPRLS